MRICCCNCLGCPMLSDHPWQILLGCGKPSCPLFFLSAVHFGHLGQDLQYLVGVPDVHLQGLWTSSEDALRFLGLHNYKWFKCLGVRWCNICVSDESELVWSMSNGLRCCHVTNHLLTTPFLVCTDWGWVWKKSEDEDIRWGNVNVSFLSSQNRKWCLWKGALLCGCT